VVDYTDYGMLQAPNFGIHMNKNSKYKCKKRSLLKTVIGDIAHLKPHKFTVLSDL